MNNKTYQKNEDLMHILEHTRELWDEIRGERIFLTGGTGFFGKWIIESFLFANKTLGLHSELHVLTRDSRSFIQQNPNFSEQERLHYVHGSMTDFLFPNEIFPFIIHAATQPSVSNLKNGGLELFSSNVEGTRRVLEFSSHCNARKLLFTSSGAVYGDQPAEVSHIPESYTGAPDTCNVNSAYGQSKRISEYLCANYSSNSSLSVKIARCFAFVGPYLPLDANFAIGNFIKDCLAGDSIHILGDGTPFRSYLYMADLMIWLFTILFRGESCKPYNVGSDFDLSIMALAEIVSKEVSPNTKISVAQKPDPRKPVSRYVPDITRAKTNLGLEVWIPLEKAIRRTSSFYRPQFQ